MRKFLRRLMYGLGLSGIAFRAHEIMLAYRLHRSQPETFLQPAADGLPLPPAKMMVLVGGDTTVPAFLSGGRAVVDAIDEMLRADGADIRQMKAVLDFGCGCGRVMRHWPALGLRGTLRGTDYNSTLINWCRGNLPFAQFAINRLQPPLDYADDAFDLVYAFSIFTHLPEKLQTAWMSELARIIVPGGYLFITLHGESFRGALSAQELAIFDDANLVVRQAGMAGSNLCTTFHPERYLRQVLAADLKVVSYSLARLGQDVALLRKPLAAG